MISPPIRPNLRSRSSGGWICTPKIDLRKLGACLVTVSMMISAALSFSSSHERPSGSSGELLAEEAGDVLARRRQAVVDAGRQLHLDDRFVGPAPGLGVGERLVHVIER